MTKGRKTTDVVVATAPAIDEATATADIENVSVAHFSEHRETFELGQIIGRQQASEFLETVSTSMQLAAYEQAKKSTAYRNIIDPRTGNAFPSIDEFCRFAFGVSDARMRQLIGNRNALGNELFEKGEQLGLGQRDYRAIRALPADDQALVQQAIETANDREAVTELLMELTERHAKKVLALEEDCAAKDKVIVQSKDHITKLVEAKNRRDGMTEAERYAELEQTLSTTVLEATAYLLPLRQAVHDVRAQTNCPAGLSAALEGALNRVAAEVLAIASDYGVVLNLAPDWIDGDGAEENGADWLQAADQAGE